MIKSQRTVEVTFILIIVILAVLVLLGIFTIEVGSPAFLQIKAMLGF